MLILLLLSHHDTRNCNSETDIVTRQHQLCRALLVEAKGHSLGIDRFGKDHVPAGPTLDYSYENKEYLRVGLLFVGIEGQEDAPKFVEFSEEHMDRLNLLRLVALVDLDKSRQQFFLLADGSQKLY